MGATGDEVACFDMLSHALIDAGELEEARSTALDAAALIKDAQAGWHVLVSVARPSRAPQGSVGMQNSRFCSRRAYGPCRMS
jgi:hypothetical protein